MEVTLVSTALPPQFSLFSPAFWIPAAASLPPVSRQDAVIVSPLDNPGVFVSVCARVCAKS